MATLKKREKVTVLTGQGTNPYETSSMYALKLGLVVGLLILGLSGCGISDPSNPNYVLAKGDGFAIHRSDLDVLVNAQLERQKEVLKANPAAPANASKPEIEQRNFDLLLDRALVRCEVQRLGLQAQVDKQAADRMQTLKQQMSPEQLEQRLATTHITLSEVEARYKDQAGLQVIFEKTGIRRPTNRLLRRAQAPMPPPETGGNIIVRQILVPAGSGKIEMARQLQAAWEKLPPLQWPRLANAPGTPEAPFPYERNQYPLEQAPAPAKAAAAKLKPGEISEVITAKEGFYVLRADSVEQQMEARQSMQNQLIEKWQAYVEELKKQYHVEVRFVPQSAAAGKVLK